MSIATPFLFVIYVVANGHAAEIKKHQMRKWESDPGARNVVPQQAENEDQEQLEQKDACPDICSTGCRKCGKFCDGNSPGFDEGGCLTCTKGEAGHCKACIVCHQHAGDWDPPRPASSLELQPTHKEDSMFSPEALQGKADSWPNYKELATLLKHDYSFDVTAYDPDMINHPDAENFRKLIHKVQEVQKHGVGEKHGVGGRPMDGSDNASLVTKDETGEDAGCSAAACDAIIDCGCHEWRHGGNCQHVRGHHGGCRWNHDAYWCNFWIAWHCFWKFQAGCDLVVQKHVDNVCQSNTFLLEQPQALANDSQPSSLDEGLSGKRSC